MKIYFEDYELFCLPGVPHDIEFVIDAGHGIKDNRNRLDRYYKENPNTILYTNSILAFSNEYAWNEDLNVPEIYIRTGERMTFTRIDKLTEKELRRGHNLAKMYLAGSFQDEPKEDTDNA